MNKIRVLVKEPGKAPEEREIENTLEAFQAIVGGHIEALRIDEEIACYIDEDGKMKSLTPNFVVPVYSAAGYDIVCGTAVFFRCGCDGSETSLTFTDVLQIKYFLRGRDLRNFVLDSRLLRELCEGVK